MTWLITGASRGLGRHLAVALAARGHSVLAAARDRAKLDELVQHCLLYTSPSPRD